MITFASLNSIWAFIAAVGAVAASFATRLYTRIDDYRTEIEGSKITELEKNFRSMNCYHEVKSM
ncbi:MAG: hypothetical protein WBL67_08680 [Nitrososphaeraceae archaeon]